MALLFGLLAMADALPPVPGLHTAAGRDGSVFARGYDPMLMESREPIIDFHFSNNNSNFNEWVYPDSANGNGAFSVPDEVQVYYTPGAEFDKHFEMFTNVTTVEHYEYKFHWSAVFALIYNNVAAKLEGFMKFVVEEQGDWLAISEHMTTYFKTNLYSSTVLAAMMKEGGPQSKSAFARELKMLPPTYITDKDKVVYANFLGKFGTHYVSEAVYGSSLMVVTALSASIAAELGLELDVSVSISLELIFIAIGLQFKAGAHGKGDINVNFTESAYVVIAAQGGDSAAFAAGNFDQWLESIAGAPVPINVSYTPLSELIDDDVISANIEAAIVDYISYWNTTKYPVRGCVTPPGANFTVAQLPDNFRATKRQATSYDPVPLPALDFSSVGNAYDAKLGAVKASLAPPVSYEQQLQWTDPNTKQTFLIPDGHLLTTFAAVCLDASETVIADASAVAELWAGFSFAWTHFKIWKIPISATFKNFQDAVSALLDGFAKEMFMLEFSLDLFHLSRGISANHTAEFAADVAALPLTQTKEYDSFVNKWGTHFVGSQGFGGYCNLTVVWEQTAFADYSEDWKKAQSRIKANLFLDKLGVQTWMNLNLVNARDKQADSNFTHNSTLSFQCTGGKLGLLGEGLGEGAAPAPGSWKQWLESIATNPQPIERNIRLRALSELVDDAQKRDLLDQAIVNFVNTNQQADAEGAAMAAKVATMAAAEARPAAIAAATVAAARASAEAALPAFQWVPGVCNGNGNVGVGCGYDATKLDINGLTINPKRPVINMRACALKCYLIPNNSDPDCEYCTYANPFDPNRFYKVPDNVFVADTPASGGCFEVHTSSDMKTYDIDITQHREHSSGFIIRHHSSKTQEDFYHMYYEKDDSQSLQSEFMEWFTVTLADLVPEPTTEFKLAVNLLPLKYDPVKYRRFIDDFGTHYISQASLGGMVLSTTFFHSCFLEQYSGEFVSEQSSTSFIFIFNDGSSHGQGTNTTNKLFEQWSETTVKMVGGEAWRYLKLDKNNTLTPEEIAAWAQTILGPKMQPIQFKLEPILDLIANPTKKDNLNKTLQLYVDDVRTQNEDLEKLLIPADPYVKPDWCQFSPHPPTPSPFAERMYAPPKKLTDLPACGPLSEPPGIDKLRAKLQAKK